MVRVNNFKYKINETGDYEKLKKKYYQEALESAAIDEMYRYSDFAFKKEK